MDWMTKEQMDRLSDADLVYEFKERIQNENIAKTIRQKAEELVTERLIAKEEAGEKARIQLASGEDVSLGDEQPYFKYTDVDAPAVHEWVKSVGLGNLIKEPKIHNASLNSNLRQLVKEGVDIPDFMQIESRRQLTKRNMK